MQGTLQIEPCEIEGYQFDFVLISRRSKERAGKLNICVCLVVHVLTIVYKA